MLMMTATRCLFLSTDLPRWQFLWPRQVAPYSTVSTSCFTDVSSLPQEEASDAQDCPKTMLWKVKATLASIFLQFQFLRLRKKEILRKKGWDGWPESVDGAEKLECASTGGDFGDHHQFCDCSNHLFHCLHHPERPWSLERAPGIVRAKPGSSTGKFLCIAGRCSTNEEAIQVLCFWHPAGNAGNACWRLIWNLPMLISFSRVSLFIGWIKDMRWNLLPPLRLCHENFVHPFYGQPLRITYQQMFKFTLKNFSTGLHTKTALWVSALSIILRKFISTPSLFPHICIQSTTGARSFCRCATQKSSPVSCCKEDKSKYHPLIK